MSFGYDPEVPAGYQEADLEMAEFEAESRRAAADRKRGICHHSNQLGYKNPPFYTAEAIAEMRAKGHFPDRPTVVTGDQSTIGEGKSLCLDCGQLLVDEF